MLLGMCYPKGSVFPAIWWMFGQNWGAFQPFMDKQLSLLVLTARCCRFSRSQTSWRTAISVRCLPHGFHTLNHWIPRSLLMANSYLSLLYTPKTFHFSARCDHSWTREVTGYLFHNGHTLFGECGRLSHNLGIPALNNVPQLTLGRRTPNLGTHQRGGCGSILCLSYPSYQSSLLNHGVNNTSTVWWF